MTFGPRTRLSLLSRMFVALAVLAVVSTSVVLTAMLASGAVVWLVLLVVGQFALSPLLVPFLDGPPMEVLLANAVPIVALSGAILFPFLYVRPVLEEIRAFRRELGTVGTPASDRDPERANVARRLAKQAGIPEPDVYIVNRRRPESYALGGRSDGTIVVTRGLVRQLSEDELRAVLAHEISHLANGDSYVMNLALVPTLIAEHVGSDEPPDWRDGRSVFPLVHLALWKTLQRVTQFQQLCSQLGVTVLSRGREFAADRRAAELTGAPSALASALQTLDDTRGRPSEDKRTWKRSASALDILPRKEPSDVLGLLFTHPDTEKRIERLETLAAEMEADGR